MPALPAVCLSVCACACLCVPLSLWALHARLCLSRVALSLHPAPPSSALSPVSLTGSLVVALTLLARELSSSFVRNEREREVCVRERKLCGTGCCASVG